VAEGIEVDKMEYIKFDYIVYPENPTFKVCKDCAVAKARQEKLNQDWKGGNQVPGKRVDLDISYIRDENYGHSCFWVLFVNDYTDYCWSIFLKHKSDLKE
jgi:hypothetical protein